MKRKENTERKGEVEKILLELSGLEKKALFDKYQTDEDGLDPIQATERLDEYGKNIIDFGKEKNLAQRVSDAIINPFNIVLLVVAAITFVTDVVLSDEPSFATFIMLVAVIIISAVISFVQEEKSNNAAKKLQGMITVTNPASTHIISTSVVTGDPELSRNIANAVLNTSIDAIYQVVGTSEPTIIDYAEAEAVKEVTPSLYRYLAIGTLAGILLACAFVTLRMLTDNTMKTDDDVERYLQLPVLAAIPFFKE